jgi:putative ABC transport system permease protein
VIRRAARSLWLGRGRYVLTFVGIVLSASFLNATLTLVESAGQGNDAIVASARAGIDAVVTGAPDPQADGQRTPPGLNLNDGTLDASLVTAVAAAPGVAEAEPSFDATGQLVAEDGSVIGQARGPANEVTSWVATPDLSSWDLAEGSPPVADDDVVLDVATARAFDVEVGDQLRFGADAELVDVTVVGTATYGGADRRPSRTTVLLAPSNPAFGDGTTTNRILVGGESGWSQSELTESVLGSLGDQDVEIATGAAASADEIDALGAQSTILSILLSVFTGVATAVGILTIANTFQISLTQRRRELALARAIGATRGELIRQTLVEASLLGLFSAAVSCLVGRGVVELLRALFRAFGIEVFNGEVVVTTTVIVSTMAVGVLTTMLAAVRAAVTATRVSPVEALRSATDAATPRGRTRWMGWLVLVGSVAVIVAGAGDATIVAVASIGLLVGAVMTAQDIVAVLGRAARPLFAAVGGPVGRLSARNAVRSPRRVAAASTAVMLSVAVITLFSVLGATVTASTAGTAGDDLRADVVITPYNEISGSVPASLTAEMTKVTAVESLASLRMVEASSGGEPFTLATFDTSDLSAAFDLKATGVAFDQLGAGEMLAYVDGDAPAAEQPQVGDVVVVRTGRADTNLQVVGTYTAVIPGFDTTNGVISLETADGLDAGASGDDRGAAAMYVVTDGSNAATQAVADAANGFGEVQTAAEYTAADTSPVDDVLNLINALLAVAVVIALVGLANTMTLSLRERSGELGITRAIGTTRAQLFGSVVGEAGLMAFQGVVTGLLVGVGVAFPLIALLDFDAVSTPVIDAAALITTAVLGLVAGVLSCVTPAANASRQPPLDAIRSL